MAPASNQRGIALVVVLLILVVISQLVLVLLATVQVETKISGHGVRETAALQIAEAGVAEAIGRLKAQDIMLNNNPRAVAQIFNVMPGSVPVLGADSTALPTAQPAGAWLNYSSPGRGAGTLTVQYKTNPARTLIYRYDLSKNPAIQTTSGSPIYVVTATGRKGTDRRTVVAEIAARPYIFNAKGAFVSGVDVQFSGNSIECGYNHRADTPTDTGISGRSGAGGCNEVPGTFWETGSGDVAGVWAAGTITGQGNGTQTGNPPFVDAQPGMYKGPWDCLGISQAEFFSWVGPPLATEPVGPHGIYYLDNNGISQDQSGSWAYTSDEGEGLLYVDGDFAVNSHFAFRGLIYVEGDFKINGNAWVLGGVVCRGKTYIKLANGGMTVLYSEEAIKMYISKYGDQYLNLSWREF